MQTGSMNSMTIFQKMMSGEIPATIIHETEDLIAIRDISPKAPIHVLVIPREPIPTTNDLKPEQAELVGKLVLAAAQIAKQEGIAEGGERLGINRNEDGGQSVG